MYLFASNFPQNFFHLSLNRFTPSNSDPYPPTIVSHIRGLSNNTQVSTWNKLITVNKTQYCQKNAGRRPKKLPLDADAYSNDTPCVLSPVKHGWKKEWSHTWAKTNKQKWLQIEMHFFLQRAYNMQIFQVFTQKKKNINQHLILKGFIYVTVHYSQLF